VMQLAALQAALADQKKWGIFGAHQCARPRDSCTTRIMTRERRFYTRHDVKTMFLTGSMHQSASHTALPAAMARGFLFAHTAKIEHTIDAQVNLAEHFVVSALTARDVRPPCPQSRRCCAGQVSTTRLLSSHQRPLTR
jgi:hypothetical protein